MRLRIAAVVVALAAVAGLPAAAGAQQRSPIQDLLTRARNALNNLEYAQADQMGRGVLAYGSQVSREERIEALQIVVAANFPEEIPSQRRDSALTYLRQLVRLAPDRDMPRSISWRGLDSLVTQTKRTTFAAIARPQRDNEVAGPEGGAGIPVTSTRPARFFLAAFPAAGLPIRLDSSGVTTQALLHVRVLAGDRLGLPSGQYTLRVTAIDAAAPDTITLRFTATVAAAAPDVAPLPAFDSTQLRLEVSPPARGRTIGVGVGLGVATVLIASMFRGEDPVKSQTSADTRAFIAAGALTVGGVVAALKDRGTPQPRNVAYNVQLRAAHQQRVSEVQAQNARKLATYRATITIDPEPR
jgi:hypothetical protein